MKQKLFKRWIRALRSGAYGQIKGSLRSSQTDFDVLGVLCDVYSKITGIPWNLDPIKGTYTFMQETERLPDEIVAALDLSHLDIDRLIIYNDINALNFNEFACYIEKRYLDV